MAQSWRRYVDQALPKRPALMSMAGYRALDDAARARYDELRRNAMLESGVLRAPHQRLILGHFWRHFLINLYAPAQAVRAGAILDGQSGLGKTTLARTFAREFEKYLRRKITSKTQAGQEQFIPVVYLTLRGPTTPTGLAEALCDYLGIALHGSCTEQTMLGVIREAVHLHGVRLFVIDDVHFFDCRGSGWSSASGRLRSMMEITDAAFLCVGIDCAAPGFLYPAGTATLGSPVHDRLLSVVLQPYSRGDQAWEELINTLESRLLLLAHEFGTLADLSAYLYDRTGGNIDSLVRLVQEAALYAVGTTERINRDGLDNIPAGHPAALCEQTQQKGRS